jgi:hypothetical protein
MSNEANTSSTSSTSAVFAAFIEADTALRELPKVRADLDAAHSLIDETNASLTAEREAKAKLEAELAQAKADLASREAALSAATFRGDKATQLLDGLRGLLGIRDGAVAGAEVSGSQSPQVGERKAEPNFDHILSEADHDDNVNSGQREADPTSGVSTKAPDTAPEAASSGNADKLDGASDTHSPTEVPNAGPIPNPSPAPPTSSSTTKPDASEAAHTPQTNSGHSDEAKAEGDLQPWSAKPYWVTWADWADLHQGQVPEWVMDRHAV